MKIDRKFYGKYKVSKLRNAKGKIFDIDDKALAFKEKDRLGSKYNVYYCGASDKGTLSWDRVTDRKIYRSWEEAHQRHVR